MKNKRENIVDCIFCVICCIIMLGLGYTWGYFDAKTKYNHKIDIPTPVEKEVIDTLYITRDSLIYRTKYLETIKVVRIIILDQVNDKTLKSDILEKYINFVKTKNKHIKLNQR